MDTGFEEDILRKTECEVYTFDHTISVQDGVTLNELSPRMHYFPYMIGTEDNTHQGFEEKSLQSIMQELGHTKVDILKMDIEGGEWDVLSAMLKANSLPFNQLQLEFHFISITLQTGLDVLAKLTAAGYRVFSVEPNFYCHPGGDGCPGAFYEYSFIKGSL